MAGMRLVAVEVNKTNQWIQRKNPRPNADAIAAYISNRWPHFSDEEKQAVFQGTTEGK